MDEFKGKQSTFVNEWHIEGSFQIKTKTQKQQCLYVVTHTDVKFSGFI